MTDLTAIMVDDAETDFRRRLAANLAARGWPHAEIPGKVEELLRREIPIHLDLASLLADGETPRD